MYSCYRKWLNWIIHIQIVFIIWMPFSSNEGLSSFIWIGLSPLCPFQSDRLSVFSTHHQPPFLFTLFKMATPSFPFYYFFPFSPAGCSQPLPGYFLCLLAFNRGTVTASPNEMWLRSWSFASSNTWQHFLFPWNGYSLEPHGGPVCSNSPGIMSENMGLMC